VAEHGIDGVCDFASVLPNASGEGFCDIDFFVPAADSGAMVLEATSDFVPLCDGWAIIADTRRDRIAVLNVVQQRSGTFFSLPSSPGELELNEDTEKLYIALPDQAALAELDLVTGELLVIRLPGSPASLAIGPNDEVLFTIRNGSSTALFWLPPDSTTIRGGWSIGGELIRYNSAYGELVVARWGGTDLWRYSFDPGSGPTELQHHGGSHGARQLALSADGEHVALAATGGNGTADTIADFDATDLTVQRGAWPVGSSPENVDFDRASERVVATSGRTIIIYAVATFAELDRLSVPYCSYDDLGPVAFSRGGSIALGKQTCGFEDEETRYHWLLLR